MEEKENIVDIKTERELLRQEYKGKTSDEIAKILNDLTIGIKNLTFRKDFLEKSVEGIYILNDGKNIVWGRGEPSALFDYSAKIRYEKIAEKIITVNCLHDARNLLKENYFAKYMDGYPNLDGHIHRIKATELYPMIYDFIQDNDIPWSSDGQCVIQFPIEVFENDNTNHVFFYISQEHKKAFICYDGFDVIRLNCDKLENYQDYFDGKRL